MKKDFSIAGRIVNDDRPPLVIAEIGINHNGSLKVAKQMVDAAIDAGAYVIKHQTHVIEDEMSQVAKTIVPGNADESIFDIMAKCALNEEDEAALKAYVEKKGGIFISTPFSRAAANRLERLGVAAYKIGSGECNNLPLLEHIISFKKPMIISTGMNSIQSVQETVALLESHSAHFCLLHTTNLYPTPSHLVRLGAMQEMMRLFPNVHIGLSDHTTDNLACFAAVALGANILERHFTDTKRRQGPDIVNSMDPKELNELIRGSNEIRKMRGGTKEAAREEKVTSDFAFATVVTTKDISKGDLITKDNCWVKRPGIGEIAAREYNDILNQRASRDISKDSHLRYDDLEKND